MNLITTELSKLKFGHEYPDGPLNDRVAGRDVEIKELAANIAANGLLQPLAVWRGYVLAGNRRLAALRIVHKADPGQPIQCVPIHAESFADALDKAISSNNYIPPHEADQFEAFNRLRAGGMTNETIRKRHSLDKKTYARIMALGGLHPQILAAWRDDKIDEKSVRAYTLEPDKERQLKIFKSPKGRNWWDVQAAIIGDERKMAGMIAFVGAERYRAGGGSFTTDLFAEKAEEKPTDLKLLTELYEAKLTTTIEMAKADGWGWVSMLSDLGHSAAYWEAKGKKAVKEKDRGKFGVIINAGEYDGRVEIKYGVVKPTQKAAEKRKKAKAKGEAAPISDNLRLRLADTLTKAASMAIVGQPEVALALALAGVWSHYDTPVHISNTNRRSDRGDSKVEGDFLAAFETATKLQEKSVVNLMSAFAREVGQSFSLDCMTDASPESRAVVDAIKPAEMNAFALKCFNAEDYFASVSKDLCMTAIIDCSTGPLPIGIDAKKADIAAEAVKLAKRHNWLPPELRTPGYTGPGKADNKAKPNPKKRASK